jgi:hypothetical protein
LTPRLEQGVFEQAQCPRFAHDVRDDRLDEPALDVQADRPRRLLDNLPEFVCAELTDKHLIGLNELGEISVSG